MSVAINVENLGKRYRVSHLGHRSPYRTVRESIYGAVGSGWSRLRGHSREESVEDFWALQDVSFRVPTGEVLGVIGRNGAGKSTLLKILSRISPPTTGNVTLVGRLGSLLEVGTGFHPELTGRENIFLNGAILGMSSREIARKFDAIVDFSGVEDFLDTPVKRYSSGMYVRLAFSVAAHLEPEILIVDEVLAVGDVEFQRKCLGQMESIARSGRTILFVSHNMSAIEGLCRSALVLEAGRVSYFGDQRTAILKYMEATKSALPRGQLDFEGEGARRPGPPTRIVAARVTSGGSYSGAGYQAGAPLEFRIDCRSQQEVLKPALGIGINNSLGQRIVTLHTEYGRGDFERKVVAGDFRFHCRMDGLALQPGDYRLKFSLEGNGDALHVMEEAMIITILPTDYYENGGKLGRGVVLCNQEWSFEEDVR